MLEGLLNFTITCTSNDDIFVCIVDEEFAPALDLLEFTYCTFEFNDTTNEPLREQCKFFYIVIVNNIYSSTSNASVLIKECSNFAEY